MLLLNQRIILDERIIVEKEEGIHHENYQTMGSIWANITLKRGPDINGSASQSCVYSFIVRKSDRLTSCTLGRLHWGKQTLYIPTSLLAQNTPSIWWDKLKKFN